MAAFLAFFDSDVMIRGNLTDEIPYHHVNAMFESQVIPSGLQTSCTCQWLDDHILRELQSW